MMRFLTSIAVTFLAAISLSCTLPRQPSENVQATKTQQIDFSKTGMIGKVKADEFNNQATGKEVPADGGQVVVMPNTEPKSLNHFTDNSAATDEINRYIFDSLLRRNPETFQWEPSLAERWTVEDILVKKDGAKIRGAVSEPKGLSGDVSIKTPSGDMTIPRPQVQEIRKGVVFTFYLRKGVKFHDGVPLTAADVKFTYDALKDEFVDAPSLQAYYKDMESCEVLDDYTVRMTYSKQYWQAIDYAGGEDFQIFPRHIYNPDRLLEKDPKAFGQRFNESPFNRSPIGTGAYTFERWDTGQQIILKRNPNYWDVAHRPHLDTIIFKLISDPVAALQALKNGEVDFVPTITAEQYEKETNTPEFERKFAKAQYYVGLMYYIGWNMRRPPFNDSKVRLAMAYGALNQPEFLQLVRYGHGVLVTGTAYFFSPDYDHSIQPYPFDPEQAKQLLLEAGWYDRNGDGIRDKDGKPFRFELLFASGSQVGPRVGALMKENLRKLGIDMTIRELEWATFLENINDRKFDAGLLGWGLDAGYDPYQLWHTSQAENRGSNHVGFGNAETDRIIDQSRMTLDEVARRKLFFDLQRIQYENQPYLFMYQPASLGVYNKRFRGVKLYNLRPGYDLREWYLPEAPSASAAMNREQ